MFEFTIIEWRRGFKHLARPITVIGLEAMKATARALDTDGHIAAFHVTGPDGMIRPMQLWRLTGVCGC